MEEYRIRSKSDLRRRKAKLLGEMRKCGSTVQESAKECLMPTRLTSSGRKTLDFNKLLSYAMLAYRGIVLAKNVKSFFAGDTNSKRRKRKRRR